MNEISKKYLSQYESFYSKLMKGELNRNKLLKENGSGKLKTKIR